MAKELETKSGNIRGVKVNLKIDDKDWKKLPVQGWVVQGDRFNLNLVYDENLDIEITLTEAALYNMADAIDEYRLNQQKKETKEPFSEEFEWVKNFRDFFSAEA
jgi:hypothetical protein